MSIPSTLMRIFFLCRHPAPDVPLLLVHVENLARFMREGWVHLLEAFCYIFMYGRDYLECLIGCFIRLHTRGSICRFVRFYRTVNVWNIRVRNMAVFNPYSSL